MQGTQHERWQTLCEDTARENDPHRFSKLVEELLEELRRKEERLKNPQNKSTSAA